MTVLTDVFFVILVLDQPLVEVVADRRAATTDEVYPLLGLTDPFAVEDAAFELADTDAQQVDVLLLYLLTPGLVLWEFVHVIDFGLLGGAEETEAGSGTGLGFFLGGTWHSGARGSEGAESRDGKAGSQGAVARARIEKRNRFDKRARMGERGTLADGDTVICVDVRGRSYLKTLRVGHQITIRGSVLAADDLVGRPEGTLTRRGQPERFRVFTATYADLVTQAPRRAEPVFPKDAGLILTRADIRPGDTVVEMGAGAGMLSLVLLRAVGSNGHLVSYERREEHARAARQTVGAQLGDVPNWTLKVADVSAGVCETGADRVVADLPEPHKVLDPIAGCLRPGGIVACFLPTVGQVADLRTALASDDRFACEQTWEAFERGWHVAGQSARPEHRMVAHTGFLSFARRVPKASG